jgi:hypothetical protein
MLHDSHTTCFSLTIPKDNDGFMGFPVILMDQAKAVFYMDRYFKVFTKKDQS